MKKRKQISAEIPAEKLWRLQHSSPLKTLECFAALVENLKTVGSFLTPVGVEVNVTFNKDDSNNFHLILEVTTSKDFLDFIGEALEELTTPKGCYCETQLTSTSEFSVQTIKYDFIVARKK